MNSVVIEFKTKCDSSLEDSFINIELDDILNEGRTCFLYGEKVYFRVSYSANLSISVTPSDGNVFLESTDTVSSETEKITFVDSEEATTSKRILNIVDYKWFGKSLGGILKVGDNTVGASSSGIAIAELTYTTIYDVYSVSLQTRSEEEYPVLIVVIGEEND